jgi:phage shock protein PspC (stress-responsive transcriptional regulator)
MMERRLYRSRTEKMIAGVCGGVAEYFNTDPTIVRLLWVLITLLGGAGVLLYIVLWIVMPLQGPPPMR